MKGQEERRDKGGSRKGVRVMRLSMRGGSWSGSASSYERTYEEKSTEKI
jgi:hypothetical protein